MTIRAQVDGKVREIPSVEALMAFVDERSRQRYPERYAPDGEPLAEYPGGSWAAKLDQWRKRRGRPVTP